MPKLYLVYVLVGGEQVIDSVNIVAQTKEEAEEKAMKEHFSDLSVGFTLEAHEVTSVNGYEIQLIKE